MKKIFAMMTILLLFVLACSSNTESKEDPKESNELLPGLSAELNEGTKETNEKLGDVSGMDKYGTLVKEGTADSFVHAAAVLYLDSKITKLKIATTMIINGVLPTTRSLNSSILKSFFTIPIDSGSTFASSVTFDNEVVLQMATQGSLEEIANSIVKDLKGQNVDITGYKLYTYNVAKADIKIAKKLEDLGIFTGPGSITGDWLSVNDSIMYYLIKKADSHVIAIPVMKNENNGTFTLSLDINMPGELNTYNKQ